MLTTSTLNIAKSIQDMVPAFGMFTGLNDRYHATKYPSSKHAIGQGMDFTLGRSPSLEESQQIKAMLQSIAGVQWVGNEYFPKPLGDADSRTTGGHFHVQTSAANGAVLTGPSSGYKPDLTMHGTEAIIPLKDQQVPVEIKLDSSLGQTLVTLKDVLSALVEGQQVSTDILERIEAASRNTASASEKTARYAGS